jgi:hypothetical protein
MPNRYRHLIRIAVRYAGWGLDLVHLVDERTGKVLLASTRCPGCWTMASCNTPVVASLSPGQDPERQRPAPFARSDLARPHQRQTGERHRAAARQADQPAGGHRLINQQAATALPPPYLPKNEDGDDR